MTNDEEVISDIKKAMGIYPWKHKPHPKCPLKEERKDEN